MKGIILSAILLLSIESTASDAQYDITMKMLGNIGVSHIDLEHNAQNYRITMHVQMDQSLSDVEHHYESYGELINAVYTPEYFIKYVRHNKHEVITYYVFEHDKKLIHKYTTIQDEPSGFTSLFSRNTKKEITNTYELLVNYSPNDTLTTFLNAKTLLGNSDKMHVNSVGFRKDERSIMLYKYAQEYQVAITDKEDDDFYITVTVAKDGLVKDILIKEYTILGSISVTRSILEN